MAQQLVPEGFNQHLAVQCPECGANPWRNCTEMTWDQAHPLRIALAEPVIARW
jgi:hypothetical protein